MMRSNFRAEAVRTFPADTIDARGDLVPGFRIQYVVKYDEGGRTFEDGPFSVSVTGPNWERDAQDHMAKTRNALEGFYRNA